MQNNQRAYNPQQRQRFNGPVRPQQPRQQPRRRRRRRAPPRQVPNPQQVPAGRRKGNGTGRKRMLGKTLAFREGLKLASPAGAAHTLALACYDCKTIAAVAHTGTAWSPWGSWTGAVCIWDPSPGSPTSFYQLSNNQANGTLETSSYINVATSTPDKRYGPSAGISRTRTVASEVMVKYTGSMVNSQGQLYVYIGPAPNEHRTNSDIIAQVPNNPRTRAYSMLELAGGKVFAPQSATTIGRRLYVGSQDHHGTDPGGSFMPHFIHSGGYSHDYQGSGAGNWDMIIFYATGMDAGQTLSFRGITHTEVQLPMELAGFGTAVHNRDAPHLSNYPNNQRRGPYTILDS